ncbi:MAG: hypothetical protein HN341_13595 [Verrucomicrobia bacterium]|jgi:hypothetical protein|nr:hypothetical protein [Verrucomicrobiota bacterium]
MAKPGQERAQIRRIQERAKGRPESVFAVSPNDVLVQIALPLVLILAIATRLLMASSQSGPSVMDLWKQYLLMRMDAVSGEWERDSGLPEFVSFDRIQWEGAWPADARFSDLCTRAQELTHSSSLTSNLLERSLAYVPEAGEGDLVLSYHELVEHYPEMALDEERREFALNHLEQRCRKWHARVENLQWEVVGQCVALLPAGDEHLDKNLATQMALLSRELEGRGVPLLPSVREEYGTATGEGQ